MRELRRRLRLVVITDRAQARPRTVAAIAREAIRAGAPALQLREKGLPPRDALPLARHLRALTAEAGALLFVNDRLDLALAAGADGIHLGPGDLPVAAARRIAPPPFVIGFSADEPATARHAVRSGADYIGCGAVYPTNSKSGTGQPIGLNRLKAVADAVPVPVVGIGGIAVGRAAAVLETGAAGCAVIGAVMRAPDPHQAVRSLLNPATRREGRPRGQKKSAPSSNG